MGAPELLLLPFRLILLLAGLLLPGAALLRTLHLPRSLAGSFTLSSALLYLVVVLFAVLHVPITLLTLTLALGAITGASAFLHLPRITLRSKTAPPLPTETTSFAPFTRLGAWTPLYVLFWGIVLWRLSTQPLTGADVYFRWSWLAEQMVHLGSLDFYPPRTAADYAAYAWPESIPPGIASLHAWSYLCGGTIRALWTSPAVLLQIVALHEFIWRLAFAWGGELAARRAVLLAAATPLLTWASIIGQETGLTALSVVAILYGLLRWQKSRPSGWLVFAALASVAGAGAREYGLAFPLLGLGLLVLMRAPRAALLRFAVIALPCAALWPLRTWILTGNPFFSLNLAGLFRTNTFFATWSASFHTVARQALFSLETWHQVARYFLLFAPAALIGAVALILHARRGLREARWCGLCVAVCAALWLVSVPFTAGGTFYSTRVLSPVLALTAAFAGYAIMAGPALGRRIADGVLIAVLLATLPFTLTLPENAYRVSPREWPGAARRFEVMGEESSAQLSAALGSLPGRKHLLTDYTGLARLTAGTDIVLTPLWSPEVAWLFDPATTPDAAADRWSASRFHYLVTSPSPAFMEFINRHARWSSARFAFRPVWQSDAYLIIEVIVEPPPAK
jgi:hypothetical protein